MRFLAKISALVTTASDNASLHAGGVRRQLAAVGVCLQAKAAVLATALLCVTACLEASAQSVWSRNSKQTSPLEVLFPIILIIFVLAGLAHAINNILVWRRNKRRRHTSPVLRGSEVSSRTTQRDSPAGAVQIGPITLSAQDETKHILFVGTTGSGKSQGMRRILGIVRSRGGRALVADASGESLSRFYKSDKDKILNPFDSRSVDWSPFAEIQTPYDCDRIAKAVIPDGEGSDKEWNHYAQTILAATLRVQHKYDVRSVKALLHLLTAAEAGELGQALAGTPAAAYCAPGNERMLAGARAVLATHLASWWYLQDDGTFSVRDWLRSDVGAGWLYVTYRDDQAAMTRQLVATILELAIVEGLSLPEDTQRDFWLFMDEVDSLGKVQSLKDALSKLRKYGCRCVLGLQTIAQLRLTYGRDGAQALMANVSAKVVLRAADGETAEYFSHEFGEQEIEREQVGSSRGYRDQSRNTTTIRETKRTVLASELGQLPDLVGYLRVPSGLFKIQVPIVNVEAHTTPFCERKYI